MTLMSYCAKSLTASQKYPILSNKEIENTEKYLYLGQTISNDPDQTIKLHRRIGQGWSAFGRFKNILVKKKIKPETKK